MSTRFSSPVRKPSTAENWPVTPIALRTPSGSRGEIMAGDRDVAAVAGISVDRIWTVVVLPAPLGPSRAKTEPSAISRSIPSRTTCFP